MKVKKILESLSKLDPETEVWANWLAPDDVVEQINNAEYEDENGEVIQVTETNLPKEVLVNIFNEIDNDEYLWDKFSETFSEVTSNVFMDYIKDKQQAIEDTELWDREGEENE